MKARGALWACFGLLVIGCDEGNASPPVQETAATRATGAGTTISATARAAAAVEPPAYTAKSISEGESASGMWTGAFSVERKQGNAGLTFENAYQNCMDAGKARCTETQWVRACEADAKLAELETWVASYDGGGKFVVRGSAGPGCEKRSSADRDESRPTRVAVCCDRAVAIQSHDNLAFRRSSAKKQLDYELALRKRDRVAVADQYDPDVSFLKRKLDRETLMRAFDNDLKRFPNQWTLFDSCNVTIGKDAEGEATLISDCKAILRRGGKPYGAMVRFVRGGNETKIRQVGFEAGANEGGDPVAAPAGGGEQKEGFGFLVPAED